jgi:tetratricopeptide (TPR) repeat protein
MREWTDADEAAVERDLEAPLAALRSQGARCPDPALLPALDAGILPPALAGAVSSHVQQCPLCQHLARDLASGEFAAAVEAAPAALPGPPVVPPRAERARPARLPRWLWRPLPAAAGMVVVLAALSAWWVTGLRDADPISPRAAPAPPSAAATAPVGTPARLPLDKPPIAAPLGAALVWRSDSPAGRERELAALGDALVPYRTDDFAEAALRLEALSRQQPSAETWFYLGVSRLFLGQADRAAADLRRARDLARPPLRQDASWYLAVALERAGALDAAAAELESLCGGDGERRARACEALDTLQPPRR